MASLRQEKASPVSATARSAEIKKLLEDSRKSPFEGRMLSTMHEFESALERELRQVVFERGIALSSEAIQKLDDVKEARIAWEFERARTRAAGIPHISNSATLDRLNRELQQMRSILSYLATSAPQARRSPPPLPPNSSILTASQARRSSPPPPPSSSFLSVQSRSTAPSLPTRRTPSPPRRSFDPPKTASMPTASPVPSEDQAVHDQDMVREIETLYMKLYASAPTQESLIIFSIQVLNLDISPYFLHQIPSRTASPPPTAQCICGSPLSEERLIELRFLAEAQAHLYSPNQQQELSVEHRAYTSTVSNRDLNSSTQLPSVAEETIPQNSGVVPHMEPVPTSSPPSAPATVPSPSMSPPLSGEVEASPVHPENGLHSRSIEEDNDRGAQWFAEVQGATMEVWEPGSLSEQEPEVAHPRASRREPSLTEDELWSRSLEKEAAAGTPPAERAFRDVAMVHTGRNRSEVVLTGGDGFPQELERVLEMLEEEGVVTSLRLGACNVGAVPTAMSKLARPIATHGALTVLELSNNAIDDLAVAFLATSLCSNTSLRFVSLAGNAIGPAGGRHIAQALKQNQTLEGLDVSRNRLGPSGVSCVAMALAFNSALRALRLQANEAGDSGASFLAEAIRRQGLQLGRQPPALCSLELQDNSISSAGASALCDALERNTTLTELDFGVSHDISQDLVQRIEDLIARNRMAHLVSDRHSDNSLAVSLSTGISGSQSGMSAVGRGRVRPGATESQSRWAAVEWPFRVSGADALAAVA